MKTDSQKTALKGKTGEPPMTKRRKSYTKEFKLEAVRLARESGEGVVRTAEHLGLNRCMLSEWISEVENGESDPFPGHGNQKPKSSLEQENAELRRQLRVALEERDILKKAAQWFAKESP